jgi:hypothetical protein
MMVVLGILQDAAMSLFSFARREEEVSQGSEQDSVKIMSVIVLTQFTTPKLEVFLSCSGLATFEHHTRT